MNQIPLYLSNNFIEWGIENDVPITQLKLQKLLYLYYARYCYLFGKRPFEDCFVRWPLGPVLTSVYEETNHFKKTPLTPLPIEGRVLKIAPTEEPFRSVFHEVVQRFGDKSASELVKLTHDGPPGTNYETAWKKTKDDWDFLAATDIQKDGEVFFNG